MYQRRVHCGYCYDAGHNRSNCPKRKQRVDALRETDPDNWLITQYDEAKRRSKIRLCKYCKEEGHNRKSCVPLKEDISASRSECREWRSQALEAMDDIGLGVGALLSTHGKLGLVVGFQWHQGSQAAKRDNDDYWGAMKDTTIPKRLKRAYKPRLIEVRLVDAKDRTARWEFPQHPEVSPHSKVEIVSKVTESFAKEAPEGWVEDDPPYDIMAYFNPASWNGNMAD